MLGPSLVLPGSLGIKTKTYYIAELSNSFRTSSFFPDMIVVGAKTIPRACSPWTCSGCGKNRELTQRRRQRRRRRRRRRKRQLLKQTNLTVHRGRLCLVQVSCFPAVSVWEQKFTIPRERNILWLLLAFMDWLVSSSHGSGRFATHVELFIAKIRHDFDRSNNISLSN